jgi:hypothetical protein
MGSVAIGTGGSIRFEGDIITQTAYCLYCDNCGSFKLMCWIPFPKWAGIVVYIIIMAIGLIGYSIGRINTWDGLLFFCGSFVVLVFFTSDSVRHLIHICRKCGNMHITRDNVLNYLENDTSILDVSYEVTMKYYSDFN